MKVSIQIEGRKASGKTHLARALINFFIHLYDNVGKLEVKIKEVTLNDDRLRTLTTEMTLGPSRMYASPSEGVIERPWPHNGLWWVKSERSSFRSIVQKSSDGNFWVIGEAVAISLAELQQRGWELDEEAS